MDNHKAIFIDDLTIRFPDSVTRDSRDGYDGFMVAVESLVEVVRVIKNEYGYDYLSSLTGVDNLPDENMEVVYHAYKSTGGPGINFKVRVPRENPQVPSLVPIYPGADFHY